MTPAWQMTHHFEICGGAQIVQPPANEFCALYVRPPNEALEVIAVISELCVLKRDVHGSRDKDINGKG